MRYRYPEGIRLLPPVPGGDRRPQRLSGFVHDHGRARNEDPHAVGEADEPAQGCVGSLYFRSPAGVRELPGERPLRIAGYGRCRGHRGNVLRPAGRDRDASSATDGREHALLQLQSRAVHRLLALCPRLRRSAGDVCSHDPGARLRVEGVREPERAFPRFRMRLVWRLRRVLPDGRADREVDHRLGAARPRGDDDLRLLRCGLQLQGRGKGAGRRVGSRAHGAEP